MIFLYQYKLFSSMLFIVENFHSRPVPFICIKLIFVFVIIKQLIYLVIWIKSTGLSLNFSLTSNLHQYSITMNNDGTTNDSGHNLMHQTNDKIGMGENAKVTQQYSDLENANKGYNEEHLEVPHSLILAVNVANNYTRIH